MGTARLHGGVMPAGEKSGWEISKPRGRLYETSQRGVTKNLTGKEKRGRENEKGVK